MASTETRPSFRLPWTAGTGESSGSSDNDELIGADDPPEIEEPQDVPQIDELSESAIEARLSARPEPAGAAPARRATKFMADLTRAMQAAAEQSRNETMTRFEADAKTFIEEIRSSTTADAADLRRKADDDVAAIRDTSKVEIARIREQTESRVAERKTGLEAEMEAHAAMIEARAERVAGVVAVFETEMAEFFERLNAEEDPTRIATMAETMPDPPSLEDVVASLAPIAVKSSPASGSRPAQAADSDAGRESLPLAEVEIDFAAAEAEAASFDGDLKELGDEDDDATAIPAASPEKHAEPVAVIDPTPPPPAVDPSSATRLVVSGLVSVASIANFKRSLARIGGVVSIGVASGPHGEFVFTVRHDAGLALSNAIVSLPGFESEVTAESDGEIQITAKEADTAD